MCGEPYREALNSSHDKAVPVHPVHINTLKSEKRHANLGPKYSGKSNEPLSIIASLPVIVQLQKKKPKCTKKQPVFS